MFTGIDDHNIGQLLKYLITNLSHNIIWYQGLIKNLSMAIFLPLWRDYHGDMKIMKSNLALSLLALPEPKSYLTQALLFNWLLIRNCPFKLKSDPLLFACQKRTDPSYSVHNLVHSHKFYPHSTITCCICICKNKCIDLYQTWVTDTTPEAVKIAPVLTYIHHVTGYSKCHNRNTYNLLILHTQVFVGNQWLYLTVTYTLW
jgi:hypothetical protein